MSDTQTRLINLLERLTVKARHACTLDANSVGMNGHVEYHLRLPRIRPGAFAIYSYKSLDLTDCAFVLMAVLEEAEARGWEWSLAWSFDMNANTPARRAHRLYPRGYSYSTLERPIAETMEPRAGGILEREVLPRLECLVLAIEAQS